MAWHNAFTQFVNPSGGTQTTAAFMNSQFNEILDNDKYLKSEIENNQLKSCTASQFGVDSSLVGDATTALNQLFSYAKDNGYRKIFFDDPCVYNVDGVLNNTENLILYGNAKISSDNISNYGIFIAQDNAQLTSKINTNTYGSLSVLKGSIDTTPAGTINIGIIGDSISTGVSVSGVKYSTYDIGGSETSVSATAGDSYYNRLIDLLSKNFPNHTFNFYNYAISGSIIQQWNDEKTFDGTTKNWINFLSDKSLDLLIIGWGMNNSSLYRGFEFRHYLEQILTHISTNFSKQPSIALVTSPRPYFCSSDTWGSFDQQMARDTTAYCARHQGKISGCYIIDVNKRSNLLRTGCTFCSPEMKNRISTHEQLDVYIDPTKSSYVKNSDNEYLLSSDEDNLSLSLAAADFVIEFKLKATGCSTNEIVQLKTNEVSTGSYSFSNPISIYPTSTNSDKGYMSMYPLFSDSKNGNPRYSKFFDGSLVTGEYFTFRIEKREEIIEAYLNDNRLLRRAFPLNGLMGLLSITKHGGTGTIAIKDVDIWVGEYNLIRKSITEEEMYGVHELDDYSHKMPYGGNGANHPSNIGLERCYSTQLEEFINDLKTS